jgi:hypothetical protein
MYGMTTTSAPTTETASHVVEMLRGSHIKNVFRTTRSPSGQETYSYAKRFSVGRVRFVVTDLRSERSPAKSPDGADKTMLGGAQKEWFKRELLSAKCGFALIFWVSSVPWIGESHTGDGWAAFSIERQEVANFIKTNCIRNLCILSGDAHMLGADDGRDGEFANDGGAPVPFLQAARRQTSLIQGLALTAMATICRREAKVALALSRCTTTGGKSVRSSQGAIIATKRK